jgi:hypothetical protein
MIKSAKFNCAKTWIITWYHPSHLEGLESHDTSLRIPSDSFGSQPFAGQVWPQNLGVKDDIQDDQSMCFGKTSIEKIGK